MSKSTTKLAVLDNVLIISFAETSLWTGRAKLTAEDLGLTKDTVPPEAVASLGSKRIIAAKDLKPLQQIRYQMRRACHEVGTKFMSGFAVPVEEGPSLVRKLEDLVKKGELLKAAFLATLDSKFDEWHRSHPKWQHIMKAGSPERRRIATKIHFGFVPMMAGCPSDENVAKNLLGAVGMMGNNLVTEVVKEASAFVKQSLTNGRESGSQKTIEPIRRLAQKIKGMRFLDPSFGCIADVIAVILKDIPTVGKVSGDHFLNMARVAMLLSDRGRLELVANDIYTGAKSIQEVVIDLTGQPDLLLTASAVTEEQEDSTLNVADIFADDTAPQIDKTTSGVLESIADLTSLIQGQIRAPQPVVKSKFNGVDF